MKKRALLIGALLITTNMLHAISLTFSGSVASDNQKVITSRYMGQVKRMYVNEGDYVTKGQLLYEIDSTEIDAKKEQVNAGIAQAELALQMNKNQYNKMALDAQRYSRLYKQDMVSRHDYEQMQLGAKNTNNMVKVSQKQISQAKAQKKEVVNQYNYLKLRAPNNGIIVSKSLNQGDTAMPGMPALVITDLSQISIVIEVPESALRIVSVGKSAMVDFPSLGLKTNASVSSIIAGANPMTHKFKVKLKFNAQGKKIYPGMYAKVIFAG
ncbi:MAG: efflux RND transporter periplasmic adaptor subunit [Sulfurovum sp.]|nr:MAG: efflux RND transporter periplasmic adaptor subunit [Sulfurovum sp.]